MNSMTDISANAPARFVATDGQRAFIARRYAAERRFRFYGVLAILLTTLFLVLSFVDIFSKAIADLHRTPLQLTINADASKTRSGEQQGSAKIRGVILTASFARRLKGTVAWRDDPC